MAEQQAGIEQSNPQRGQGGRFEDCRFYDTCLDHAATEDWEGFHCEVCPLNQLGEDGPMTEITKPENTRICSECKERKTIHPNSSLCASCMARRSNKAKDTASSVVKEKKGKPQAQGKDPGEISSPGGDLTLSVDFSEHPDIFARLRDLAAEEVRPIGHQVLFCVKWYVTNSEEEAADRG